MKKRKTFKLSDTAISFVSKYALKELNINSKIDEKIADEIFIFAENCELNLIDENGSDKDYDYPEKERDILGDLYVSEVSGYYSKNIDIDLDELNKKLKLK